MNERIPPREGSTATSANSARPGKEAADASCRSCAQLVQEILQNPESRPRQVLQSLISGMTKRNSSTAEQASFRLKPVEDGVEVEMRVPDATPISPQHWTQVAPKASPSIGDFSRPSLPVLATSSSTVAPHKYTTETIKIECRPCENVGPEQGARALIMGPTPLSIVACTNRLTPGDGDEMSQILVHELLHAYDVRRLHLDFADCESMAYSEVRAAREAECFHAAASWQGPSFLKEYCVKQKAIAATHNLFPSRGRQCVRAVFATAYRDPRPFQEDDLHRHVQEHSNPNNKDRVSGR